MEERKVNIAAKRLAFKYQDESGDVENAFKEGVDWFLDNIKRNPREKPNKSEKVIVQLREDESWHSAIFNGYDFDIDTLDKENELSVSNLEINHWFPIDDLFK